MLTKLLERRLENEDICIKPLLICELRLMEANITERIYTCGPLRHPQAQEMATKAL